MVRSARGLSEDTDSFATFGNCDDSSIDSLGDFFERLVPPKKQQRTVGSSVFSQARTAATQESTDIESTDIESSDENSATEDGRRQYYAQHSLRVSMDGALHEVIEGDEGGSVDSPSFREAIGTSPDQGRVMHQTASVPRSSRVEPAHQRNTREAFQQVNESFVAASHREVERIPHHLELQKLPKSMAPQPDYALGNHNSSVGYGYGDVTPDHAKYGYEITSRDDNKANKYGYGNDGEESGQRGGGARYDYGYGEQHDMDSTWHHHETANKLKQKAEQEMSGSWHPRPEPRRRLQRRSSVTKYNLDESIAQVQQEDIAKPAEEEAQKPQSMKASGQDHDESFTHKPPVSYTVRHEEASPKTKKSKLGLKRLRQFFRLGRKRRQEIPRQAKARRPLAKRLFGTSQN